MLDDSQNSAYAEILGFATTAKSGWFSLGGCAGSGKALDINTLIATPSGWATMGSLQVGDQVFAPDGTPTSVVYCSPIQLERKCYRVEFSDGSCIVADAEHLWHTMTYEDRCKAKRRTTEAKAKRSAKRNKSGKVGWKPVVCKAPPLGSVRTTEEVLATLTARSGSHVNHSIAVCKPLLLPTCALAIDPYVLGLWLGDGSTNGGEIRKPDTELDVFIRDAGFECKRRDSDSMAISVYGLRTKLKEIGVFGNKHIPSQYLRASFEQRLALAQGLLDTDGHAAPKVGDIEFGSSIKELALQAHELFLSLGCKAVLSEKRAMLKGVDYGPAWRVLLMSAIPMFRLPRKLANQKLAGFRGTHSVRYISNVVEVPSVPVRCIQVAHESHCYLAGKEMIITHNTTLIAGHVLPELVLNKKMRVAVATPTARAARVLAEKLDPEVKAQLRHLGTIHSLLYKPVLDEDGNIIGWKKKTYVEDVDLILVDECSMVDHVMEEDLLGLRKPIIAVGDHCQLSPVNGISTWMRRASVRLDQVHRQALESPVLRLATVVRETGRLPLDLTKYGVGQHLKFSMAAPTIRQLYYDKGIDNVAIACFTNSNRCRINLDMQFRLWRQYEPCEGTQVVCLKNNKAYGLCNGDRGILSGNITEDKDYILSDIVMDNGDSVSHVYMNPKQFGEASRVTEFEEKRCAVMDLGYALTVHKMQGSSFDEVFILKDMPRSHEEFGKWVYTAISRAVHKVHFVSRL